MQATKATLILVGYKAVFTRIIEITDISFHGEYYLSGDETFPASQVLPLVKARKAKGGQARVSCPYCCCVHYHDIPVGRMVQREAECSQGDYFIELGDETATEYEANGSSPKSVTALTSLILEINQLIDTGRYNDVSFQDVHEAIKNKRVLRFLRERAGQDIDLGIHLDTDTYGDFEAYYEQMLNDVYGGYVGLERRKWGVKHLGLCLLLALTNEIIQRGGNLEWPRLLDKEEWAGAA